MRPLCQFTGRPRHPQTVLPREVGTNVSFAPEEAAFVTDSSYSKYLTNVEFLDAKKTPLPMLSRVAAVKTLQALARAEAGRRQVRKMAARHAWEQKELETWGTLDALLI